MSTAESPHPALFARLVDGLYVEAMVMADEARAYFDRHAEAERSRLDVMTRLSFTCESLKVTTRLMHIIAWLLTQRAWQRGEVSDEAVRDPKYRLGAAAPTEAAVLAGMPETARDLVLGSQALYERVLRLQQSMAPDEAAGAAGATGAPSPAHDLLQRLERSL